MQEPRKVLVMTSTIIPPAEVLDLARTDPAQRLEDYKKALEFYLGLLDNHDGGIDYIIYCDNSLADLTPLKEIVKEYNWESRVEFISFYGLDYPAYKGRGYGEFQLMDYLITNSEIINALESNNTPAQYWKVSGRYIIKNLRQMIKSAPKDFNLYLNLKHHSFIRKFKIVPNVTKANWADIFLYSFTLDGYYKYLNGIYKILGEKGYKGICAEYQLFPLLSKVLDKQFYFRFNTVPDIYCIRGYTNTPLRRNGWRRFIYSKVRRVLGLFDIWV